MKDVKFHGIADKGLAVGRNEEGKVFFVENAVPGDVADVFVLRNKKGVPFGFAQEITTFSDERVIAPCPHFDYCGGCKWQNLNYQSQLKYKQINVVDAVRKIAKQDPELVLDAVGSEKIFEYRNKLEFTFSNKRWLTPEEIKSEAEVNERDAVGFHISGAFDKVLDIFSCQLQDNKSNEIRNFIRDFAIENELSFFDLRIQKGLLRTLIIRNTTLGEWMVTMVFFENNKKQIQILLEAVKERFPDLTSIQYIVNAKKNDTIFDQEAHLFHGKRTIREKLGHVYFDIGVKSFFQTNTLQAEQLYSITKDFAGLQGDELVFDLYTGLGSIALYVADQCRFVVGIEEVEPAIADAKLNCELNNISNAAFYAGDVKDLFNETLIQKYGKPDVIITDPPRAGMHGDVVDMLLNIAPKKIVYVSCNPSTQARDIQLLSAKYNLVKLQPVDMFPHTHHIESVALLTLKTK